MFVLVFLALGVGRPRSAMSRAVAVFAYLLELFLRFIACLVEIEVFIRVVLLHLLQERLPLLLRDCLRPPKALFDSLVASTVITIIVPTTTVPLPFLDRVSPLG